MCTLQTASQIIANGTGFIFFVLSLQKGHYKFQFSQFAWIHMALFLIVGQTHFVINNVFEGFIWFFLPIALVVTNDIFAYLCGVTFGRTPLIKISPKKTWEGFLGAWFFTVLLGVIMTYVMAQYKYFICPVNVCDSQERFCPRLIKHRTSAQMSYPVWNAPPIRSSLPKPMLFHSFHQASP